MSNLDNLVVTGNTSLNGRICNGEATHKTLTIDSTNINTYYSNSTLRFPKGYDIIIWNYTSSSTTIINKIECDFNIPEYGKIHILLKESPAEGYETFTVNNSNASEDWGIVITGSSSIPCIYTGIYTFRMFGNKWRINNSKGYGSIA